MHSAAYADILRRAGFFLIARVDYRLSLSAWWNPSPNRSMQVMLTQIGDAWLIKGDKTYYLQSVSRAGETWARDLPALHDWLESHLPEVRISLSHLRDVPPDLAEVEVRRRAATDAPTRSHPSLARLITLQREQFQRQERQQVHQAMSSMLDPADDALSRYLHSRQVADRNAVDEADILIQRERERLDEVRHLQQEYQRNGSAAVYAFSIHSSLQLARDEHEFSAALHAVTRELQEQHRYHITQKLQGGRLNVQVAEATEPAVAWIEQWLGGTLNPTQLARIERQAGTQAVGRKHVMVIPDDPIELNDHVRADGKMLGARVVSTVLGKLDKTEDVEERRRAALQPEGDSMGLWLGHRLDANDRVIGRAMLPLDEVVHAAVSGTTGSGKSYLARVIVEEAMQHAGLGVLVIDPRNQFAGLMVREDRSSVLSRYATFDMSVEQTRGFAVTYHAPGPDKMLSDSLLDSLAEGCHIVSFKALDEAARCAEAANVLNAVFRVLSAHGESDTPRLLVMIDEAHLFTRRRVDEPAKADAIRSENAIDQVVREGRKYGIVLVAVSQSMRDFSRDLASVRQMTATKAFLRNSDNEIDYAAAFLSDAKSLVRLPTGTAILHNASWGELRVRIRPPWSKVCELSEPELLRLFSNPLSRREQEVSSEARKLLELIRNHHASAGPANMSQLADLSGITSKRKLGTIVNELQQAGLVLSRKLPERGSPRLIEPNTAAGDSRT